MAAVCTRLSLSAGRRVRWRMYCSWQGVARAPSSLQPLSVVKIRLLSTKVIESEVPLSGEEEKASRKLNRTFIGRFFDWMNSDIGRDEYVMSEKEKLERDDLLRRVQEMYFAKPPIVPDLDFYKEVFEKLIKYNDRVGVETLYRLMGELGVKPDHEVITLVEPFLEKSRRNVWFE